jgi:CheY-like chemotaxis protein
MLKDGERARDIVKQILTFSRKTRMDMKPQLLHELVLESLVLERASLLANIDIKQNIDLNGGSVLCDKTQIHQIILNLCNNAQHAMGEKGGTLTVSLKPTRASLSNGDPESDAIELKVSDTGHGIDASGLEKVFDPFFTTKQFGQGTGLGLSVIHGIVEMMDGQITVTSELGKGTTFRILFPVTAEVEADAVIKSVGNEDVNSRSILLVDDEESIRSVTQIILMREGFKVDSASDGTQALELFKANPGKYDLIVTDKSMPKMSGVELTKAIRDSKSDIPIMLSTGQLGVADEKEFKDIGITAFIQKPWTANELIEKIQQLDT